VRTFVGFGCGPIQAGLFLAEAYRSGAFSRLVVAEILPDVAEAVRRAGAVGVNIAHADRIQGLTIRPVEIYEPEVPQDRVALVAAVASADLVATALPGVEAYAAGGRAGMAALLADGLRRKAAARGPLAVIYTAENHVRAAELLEAAVAAWVPSAEWAGVRRRVQCLDTVIGKMSGGSEARGDLIPIAPGLERAFLVESFNRLLTSPLRRPGDAGAVEGLDPGWAAYRDGLGVCDAMSDLTPFAQAKLYGHNAGHALAAYLARCLGFSWMPQLRDRPDVLAFVEGAMREESGVPLIRRHAGVDPLFSAEGFRVYARDLALRMVNPFLRDAVARVGRDPARKLGWDDRLIGAMRLALEAGIAPRRYAWGAAAALDALGVSAARAEAYLRDLWRAAAPDPECARALLDQIREAYERMRVWTERGCPSLDDAGGGRS
jgi:mannitol-1-phosphate 5-dehydrogenase